MAQIEKFLQVVAAAPPSMLNPAVAQLLSSLKADEHNALRFIIDMCLDDPDLANDFMIFVMHGTWRQMRKDLGLAPDPMETH